MTLHKKLSTLTLGLYTASVLVVPLAAVVPASAASKNTSVAPHSTYEQCLTNVAKVDDLSNMRKRINDRAKIQLNILNTKVRSQVNTLAADQKTVLNAGIESDAAVFNKAIGVANDTNVTDVKTLWTTYCSMFYTTQVSKFRYPQAGMLNVLNRRLVRDTALQTTLATPYDTTYKGLLKEVINPRYADAKSKMDANVAAEKATIAQLLAAKVDVNSHQPTVDVSTFGAQKSGLDGSFKAAYTEWTEAGALRGAAKKVQPDLTVGSATVVFLDANGKAMVASNDTSIKSLKQAKQATVTVNVGGKNTDFTVKRSAPGGLWR